MEKYFFDRNTLMNYTNPDAEVVIVGITPGNSQTENSRNDKTPREIKRENAFVGVMRTNLVKMLDFIKLNKFLGIKTCDSFWEEDFDRVEMTSLLKDATYTKSDRKMFNDASKILKDDELKKEFEDGFLKDCKKYKKAKVFIGLGKETANILETIKNNGVISAEIIGIPHASGANAGRIAVFLGERNDLKDSSYEWAVQAAKNAKRIIGKLQRK